MYGSDVIGDITWRFDPFDEEMDMVSELIVEDFNEDETDSFIFHMIYNGETIDTVELTHIDLLDLVDDIQTEDDMRIPTRETIRLFWLRDDGIHYLMKFISNPTVVCRLELQRWILVRGS